MQDVPTITLPTPDWDSMDLSSIPVCKLEDDTCTSCQ